MFDKPTLIKNARYKNACIFLYNMFKYDHTDKVKT